MNGASKRRKLSTLIILQFWQKSNADSVVTRISAVFSGEKLGAPAACFGPAPPAHSQLALDLHGSARRQRLLAVSALELVKSPSVRSWSNSGPVLPVVVVAGIALVINVDASALELFNKGVDVCNRYYAIFLSQVLSWPPSNAKFRCKRVTKSVSRTDSS